MNGNGLVYGKLRILPASLSAVKCNKLFVQIFQLVDFKQFFIYNVAISLH